jgi:hypothetical protein
MKSGGGSASAFFLRLRRGPGVIIFHNLLFIFLTRGNM